jgi:hypothetical protein
MPSIEPLLRNLNEEHPSIDETFKARLRMDLEQIMRSRQLSWGLRWRTFVIAGLASLLFLLLLRPGLAQRGNNLLFGVGEQGVILNEVSQPIPLSQWVNQNQNGLQVTTVGGQHWPQSIQKVITETHFVMRQMMLENGEMIMVLSEVPQAKNQVYRLY